MSTPTPTCPWQLALAGNSEPLCKHICATIVLGPGVQVVGAHPYVPRDPAGLVTHIEVVLRKQRKTFSYKILMQVAASGEPVLQAMNVLTHLIMADPLLMNGVTDYECLPDASHIVFHGHKVDITPYFDGKTLQTSAIVTEIIRKVSTAAGHKHICSIGMVPVTGNIAFLECEDTVDGHRYYEESNIRKWVSSHGTSPFTRSSVSLADIRITGPAAVPVSKQPALPTKRKAVDTDKPVSKKTRVLVTRRITAVWDRSGSMSSMYEQAKEGLKKVIRDQQANASSSGNPTLFTLFTFDDEMEMPLDAVDISTVDVDAVDAWIEPRRMTRLFDTIVTAASKLRKEIEQGNSGLLIVMTDGQDNSSESSQAAVKNTLEALQKDCDVECIFMAANIGDAQEVGQSMGFSEDTSLTFTAEASDAAFESMSQSAMRSVTGGSAAFTRTERQRSVEPFGFQARSVRMPQAVRANTAF